MKKNKWNFIIIAIITAIVLYIILKNNDINQLRLVIKDSNKVWIITALMSMVLYWLFEALILYLTCNNKEKKLHFRHAIQTTMVGQLFNNLTPFASGGQPIQAYYLKKKGIAIGESTSALLIKFIVYQSTLIVYSAILLFLKFSFFTNNVPHLGYFIILGFLFNLVVVITLLGIGFFPVITRNLIHGIISLLKKMRIVKKKEKLIKSVDIHITEFHEGFQELRKNKNILIMATLLSVLQLTALLSIPYFILLAFHVAAPPYVTIISANAFLLMVTSFIPLPGSSGGAEGSFYLFFNPFFPKAGTITIALMIWRFITFYVPLFVGLLFCKSNHTIDDVDHLELLQEQKNE